MIGNKFHTCAMIITAILLFTSCSKVVVIVDDIPENTPAGENIYIVGNFNSWDPGEEKYRMKLNDDSIYVVALPPGFGKVEYKFTRGNWSTVERDLCGYEIGNRSLNIGEIDTINHSIQSWKDLDPVNCPRITLVVKDIPTNTPEDENVAIAGNFNSWNQNGSSVLQKDSVGNYSITIDRPAEIDELEFKMTRGDLSTAEADKFGNDIPNRVIQFGLKDTVEVSIAGWVDKQDQRISDRVVIILEKLPRFTAEYDEFFLVSNLNSWVPGDRNYIFQMNQNGQYFYPVPRKKKKLEFKITRGDWISVEVDKYGFDIPNRIIDLEKEDTILVDVMEWKDRSAIKDNEITIILSGLPKTTPENADIYIAGNLNGWSQRSRKHKFLQDDNGSYYINIPRRRDYLEFKIIRGSWNKTEVGQYGLDIPNRVVYYKDIDTMYINIENWSDIPTLNIKKVTIVIENLPDNTPLSEEIYFAPDFNGWNPGDRNMIFKPFPDGKYYIDIPATGSYLEYKITRGDWGTVEVDQFGNEIPNRKLYYGFTDTISIEVIKWRDLDGNY